MNSPDFLLIEDIHTRWQEIFDSGIRIASSLVGRGTLDQALEMKKTETEIMRHLSEEEKQAYYGRKDAFEGFVESFSPQSRLDAAMERATRDTSEIPEHDKIIELAEKAPLIASNHVESAEGFTLARLDPKLSWMGGVLLQPPPEKRPSLFIEAPRGFMLSAETERVTGEEVISQGARTLQLMFVSHSLLRFYQQNFHLRMETTAEDDETGDFIRAEIPPAEEVEPDLSLSEINSYITRHAEQLVSMESLSAAELYEEIMPHLQLGWTPSDNS